MGHRFINTDAVFALSVSIVGLNTAIGLTYINGDAINGGSRHISCESGVLSKGSPQPSKILVRQAPTGQ